MTRPAITRHNSMGKVLDAHRSAESQTEGCPSPVAS